MNRRARWALLVLVVVSVTGVQTALAGLGVPRLALLVLAVAVVVTVRALRRDEASLARSPIYLAGVAWLAVQGLSALFASDQKDAFSSLLNYSLAAITVVTLAAMARSDQDRRMIAAAAVISMTALGLLTIIQEGLGNPSTLLGFSLFTPGDAGPFARHSGPLSDANFWGRNLVLILPLAMWLATTSRRLRSMWWAASAILLVAIFLSGSRGAYVACLVSLVLWLMLLGPRQRRGLIALPVAVSVFAAVPGVLPRILQLADVGAVLSGGGDPSLVGRVQALRYGLQIAADHPVTGVGPGNFVPAVQSLQEEFGSASTEALAPHNAFLQMAAESGVPGLAAWLALCLVVAASLVGALLASSVATTADRRARGLVVALLAGMGGWIVASLFLHLQSLPTVAVVLGLCVSACLRPPAPTLPVADQVSRTPRVRGRLAVALVSVISLLVLEAGVLTLSGPLAAAVGPRWEASMGLVVTPSRTGAAAYPVSLSSRQEVVATFAELTKLVPAPSGTSVLTRPVGASFQARPAPSSSVIYVTSTADSRRDAVTAVRAQSRQADEFLRVAGAFFVLPRGTALEVTHPGHPVYPILIYLLGQLLATGSAFAFVRRLAR